MNSKFKLRLPKRNDIKIILPVILFFIFTMCIFGPLELYFTNIDSLWFSATDVIISIILPSALVFIIICGLYIFLDEKYKMNFIVLIFSIALGLYIQGNFMNINYGVLDGNNIPWEKYTLWAIANVIIWIIIIIMPFILKKFKPTIFQRIVPVLSYVIILVQVVTIGVLSITIKKDDDMSQYFLSQNNMLELSVNKNIVIFVLDTFDDVLFKEIIEGDSSYTEKLEGFTYFENSVGSYSTTKGALPFILTQRYYKNEEPYTDYIKKAYSETNFYRELYENNFDIQLLTSNGFVDNRQNDIISNIEKSSLKVLSRNKLAIKLYRFTAYRYMPHILKKYFWFYSGDFDELKDSRSVIQPFSNDNILFYNKLINDNIKLNDKKNAFRFYHLDGVHPPYNTNENLERVDNAKAIDKAKGALNIVYEYMRQMKDTGIYDNSTIIIMADHGFPNMSNPIFLMKQSKCNSGFYINDKPVSHNNLHASIMNELNLDYADYGSSVFEDNKKEVHNERKFMYYNWDDSWDKKYLPEIYEYEVSNESNKIEDFYLTDNIYTENGITKADRNYYLNTKIKFDGDTKYFYYGVSGVEGGFTWTSGKRGKLKFHIDNYNNYDLKFKLEIGWILGESQRLKISNAGKVLYEETITGTRNIEFLIPKEYIADNNLFLDLEYPDAITPKELGINEDPRQLAFALISMCIEEINED